MLWHNMTVLYPNLCYNEMCYKGTALYRKIDLNGLSSICMAYNYLDQEFLCSQRSKFDPIPN